MKTNFARRWFIGTVAAVLAGGPIIGAIYLLRWVDGQFREVGWLSSIGWMLVILSLVAWPAYLPDILRSILQANAGLEVTSKDVTMAKVVPNKST